MSASGLQERTHVGTARDIAPMIAAVSRHQRGTLDLRRAVCLFNAGRYDDAVRAFECAAESNPSGASLAQLLVACCRGGERRAADGHRGPSHCVGGGSSHCFDGGPSHGFDEASSHCGDGGPSHCFVDSTQAGCGIGASRETTMRIEQALSLWVAGRGDEAIRRLRCAVADDPESAELHHQLGVVLADRREYVEAELRFTQAVNIDRHHTEALLNLAMCCGVRRAPEEALKHLHRAAVRAPYCGRIGVRLAQTAAAIARSGAPVSLRAALPPDPATDDAGIEQLRALVDADLEVGAVLAAVVVEADHPEALAFTLAAFERTLERAPDCPDLNLYRGQVLAGMNRLDEAIGACERAIEIEPGHARALVELGRLYIECDRHGEAAARLERAVAAGVADAEVHRLLGDCYRARGMVGEARSAHRCALLIEQHLDPADNARKPLSV